MDRGAVRSAALQVHILDGPNILVQVPESSLEKNK